MCFLFYFTFFFFFQAEDGIRDVAVTGVQTCALPICSHSCCQLSTRFPAAEKSKISGPMLSEQSSGRAALAPSSRASRLIVALPPVEMLITASQLCLMRGRNAMKSAARGLGLPSAGLRAWRWRIAAPASAAPIAASAIWSAVTGRCGDIDGVWIEPVGAQVMMTLLDLRIAQSPAWQTYLMFRYSSRPWCDPSRPRPDI